jgi:serine protease Do
MIRFPLDEGKVIGINSAILTRTGGYQGIGFTIPINRAKTIMRKLIESGKIARPHLGVELSEINDSLARQYGLENLPELLRDLKMKELRGAFILSTLQDSPAQKTV